MINHSCQFILGNQNNRLYPSGRSLLSNLTKRRWALEHFPKTKGLDLFLKQKDWQAIQGFDFMHYKGQQNSKSKQKLIEWIKNKLITLTAGLARFCVRGKRRVPAPPPRMIETTDFGSAGCIIFLTSASVGFTWLIKQSNRRKKLRILIIFEFSDMIF